MSLLYTDRMFEDTLSEKSNFILPVPAFMEYFFEFRSRLGSHEAVRVLSSWNIVGVGEDDDDVIGDAVIKHLLQPEKRVRVLLRVPAHADGAQDDVRARMHAHHRVHYIRANGIVGFTSVVESWRVHDLFLRTK
jgi:hypothetical protein